MDPKLLVRAVEALETISEYLAEIDSGQTALINIANRHILAMDVLASLLKKRV